MNESKKLIRDELESMKFEDYLFCKIKDGECSGTYRVLNYFSDIDMAVVTNDGITLIKVPLEDIVSIERGCFKCDVVRGRTQNSFIPNIVSQAEAHKNMGHKYCFNCGREL